MSTHKSSKSKKRHRNVNSSASSSSIQAQTRQRDQVYDTANIVLDVTANIAEGSDILAPLKAVCRATKSILEVMRAIESNKEEWIDLTRRLKEYMSTFEEQIASFETYSQAERVIGEALNRPLNHYIELLRDIHSTVVDLREKRSRSKLSLLKGFSRVKVDSEEIRKLNRDVEDRHRQLMSALGLFTASRVQAIERSVAILQLPTVAFVASSVHRLCLEGTREAVLQTIWNWANDSASDKPIFWLCDIAGSGKSTVAMSAVESWRKKGVLGGRFFFSMASSEGSTTDKFCSTIARDLVQYIPELIPHVAGAVKQNPSFMRSSLGEQLQILVTDPLHHWQGHVILVIDALDECKSGPQRRELVETLSTAVSNSKNLRILMTSRPDPIIEDVLGPLAIKSKMEGRLHDASHRDNIDDIAIYVHQSLGEVLSDDKKQRLVQKANGLFIWASTACRMLTSKTSFSSTEEIYDHLISRERSGAIDDVYDLVLERTGPEHRSVMCGMLALLLAAFEPLTLDDLDDILKHNRVRGSAKALVQNLGSVLTSDKTTNLIQFRHPTIVEYLRRRSTAPTVDGSDKIYINIANAHGQAASWCFKYLRSPTEGLRFNICQIESSFYLNRQIPDLDTRIAKFIPRRLRYASSHWLFHVAATDENGQSTVKNDVWHTIQVPYVFYWLEILSLTRGLSRAIAGLRAITHHSGLGREITSRMNETRRFMMAFSVPIQDSAPHIYISALPFTPIKTSLHVEGREKFRNTLNVTRGLEDLYPGLPNSLRGHEGGIWAVAISPDGSQIASASSDRTIRLWDADTGHPLGKPLRGHKRGITGVAFSSDGSRIVSGSHDGTVRQWDAHSGQPLGEPLQGHDDSVWAAEFSPDGSRIVSGSDDETVRVWDVDTGQLLGEPLRGHTGGVKAVAFSPDSLRVISCSNDRTIRLWDAATGQPLGGPLRGHEQGIKSVAFSSDGSRIVSGSGDGTVRLWDVDSGQPLGEPLRGHDNTVWAVKFSPDDSRIVSGSDDETIRVWDADTGQILGEPLRGHEGGVNSVTVSLDGSQIISGSDDHTVRIWDAISGKPLGQPIEGHKGWVCAVAFSPDGLQVASGSTDSTIRLWDAQTGQSLWVALPGHEGEVYTIAFSPDGSRIVSGSSDETIRLWDAGTGLPLIDPLRGHTKGVRAVAFSPDGLRIASGSSDQTVRLWDLDSGQPLGRPFKGHTDLVRAVSFSPDGARLASGSDDGTIQFWDANTLQPLGEPIRGHAGGINTVAFSSDGSRIASGADDRTVRLWDVDTGQPLREPLRGHDNTVWAVEFSPDGSQVVSGSDDETIRLWDANTGQPLGEPLHGHKGGVNALSFSPDGSRLISGADDNTVRLWDVRADVIDEKRKNPDEDDRDSAYSDLEGDLSGTPLRISVPGFERCSLLSDGWVQSSGKFLFWVPPENRNGLQYPHLLTMPSASPYRATKLDFAHFKCGLSWVNIWNDAS